MDPERTKRDIIRATHRVAHYLIKGKGKPYPYGVGVCVRRGAAQCVFGEVLAEAVGPPQLLVSTNGQSYVANSGALAAVLDLSEDQLPDHLKEALVALSNANDHDKWTDRQKRSEVADRLFYLATTLEFADCPTK